MRLSITYLIVVLLNYTNIADWLIGAIHLKPKILVHGLSNNRAGTEAVIRSVVTALCDDFDFDFLVYEDISEHVDLLNLGNNRQIISPGKGLNYFNYSKYFKRFFSEHSSEYYGIWVNRNNLRNIDLLKFSYEYNIPKRIIHMHSVPVNTSPIRCYLELKSRNNISKYATDYWACSKQSASAWFPGKNVVVIPNAVDADKFKFDQAIRAAIRSELGIFDELLIGHIGRFSNEKNQSFLIDVFAHLHEINPTAKLIFIGEGNSLISCKNKAKKLGLSEFVLFLGNQKNVNEYYSALDVFALPSKWEGLPVTLVESQFNGVPSIISDSISDEVVFSNCIDFLPVNSNSYDLWVDVINEAVRSSPTYFSSSENYRLDTLRDRILPLFINN